MKKFMMNKMKRVVATVMMACMLLTVMNVSSDTEIRICGEVIVTDTKELE